MLIDLTLSVTISPSAVVYKRKVIINVGTRITSHYQLWCCQCPHHSEESGDGTRVAFQLPTLMLCVYSSKRKEM